MDLKLRQRMKSPRGKSFGGYRTGDKVRMVGLTDHEVAKLAAAGDKKAMTALLARHAGLLHRVATMYNSPDLTYDDLRQEAALGLMIAIYKFDPDAGASFITYASLWIRACVTNACSRRVGASRSSRKVFFNIGKAKRALEDAGIEVTRLAIAEHLGVEECHVNALNVPVSLNAKLSDGSRRGMYDDPDIEFLDVLTYEDGDVHMLSPEDAAIARDEVNHRRQKIERAMSRLKPREREVIRRRFFADEPETLDAIGKSMGVSRERARQLEANALYAMKPLLHDLV